jgi:plastocyanin
MFTTSTPRFARARGSVRPAPRLRAARAVAAGLLLSLAAGGAVLADDMGVQILDTGFSPAETTLHPAGAAVHWVNMGTQSHSVKFADGVESPVLAPGQTWERTFDALGDYAYTCGVHPEVTGMVHVVTMEEASTDDGSGGSGTTIPETDTAPDASGGGSGFALLMVVLGSAAVGSLLVRRRVTAA